jgi:type I restriction enzyme S subunit
VTQNKIIEDLKKLKSAIIDRVFNESTNKEVRLGEIGIFVRGLAYSAEHVTECKNDTIVIRANNLTYGEEVDEHNDIVYVDKCPSKEQILRKGDIVICMANGTSNLVGKNSIYNGTNQNITIGAFCCIYRTDYSLIRWLMQTKLYKCYIQKALQGGNGAIANLNVEDVQNLCFPKITKEHELFVSHYLSAIDNKIKNEKNLLFKYDSQKRYLLQQMFI